MSPASGNIKNPTSYVILENPESFHSINVPSEWEHIETETDRVVLLFVSIQLMSPASGNFLDPIAVDESNVMFPFN